MHSNKMKDPFSQNNAQHYAIEAIPLACQHGNTTVVEYFKHEFNTRKLHIYI